MSKKVVRCIICPKACSITVEQDNKGKLMIKKAGCKKGREYATEEYENPRRILTTTVRVLADENLRYLPVKTEKSVPKDGLAAYMRELAKVTVRNRVQRGDKIYSNIGGSGVDVVASTDSEMLLNNN